MVLEFDVIKNAVQKRYDEFFKQGRVIFQTSIDKDALWALYLESFPPGSNPMFRERTEHDCSCCRQFIRNMGGVVAIVDGKIETLWDFTMDNAYGVVAKALHEYVIAHSIESIYYSETKQAGTNSSVERLEDGKTLTWTHFSLMLEEKFVKPKAAIGTARGRYNGVVDVFARSLKELTLESFAVVLELIDANMLPRGNEFRDKVIGFLALKNEYDALETDEQRELFAWVKASTVNEGISRVRNSAVGTLLIDLSGRTKEDGEVVPPMELDPAVRKFEVVVAGENYKRPKALFTEKQRKQAVEWITENGYLESLERRFAKVDDINVSDILFRNRNVVSKTETGVLGILEGMSKDAAVNPKKFSSVEEISIADFIANVLPHATGIEAMLENKHTNNMVSLVAPMHKDAKSMLKWGNNFSWAYNGNITDSSMRDRVAKAGGKVDGVLRFSIQWNDGETHDNVDLDAHCYTPSGAHIYFSNPRDAKSGGNLDVDITSCTPKQIPVENITFPDLSKMPDGVYKFGVKNYSGGRGAKSGFRAEVAFAGEIFEFDYAQATKGKEYVEVAEVTLKNGEFSVKELLPSTTSSRELWNVNTNQFVPVSVLMRSPNFWEGAEQTGNEHYFFMIKDCVNSDAPNGFFPEFLTGELHDHRRFFEALGSKMRVQDTDEQLSGIGFNTYRRAELVVKVTGATERVMKIKF